MSDNYESSSNSEIQLTFNDINDEEMSGNDCTELVSDNLPPKIKTLIGFLH